MSWTGTVSVWRAALCDSGIDNEAANGEAEWMRCARSLVQAMYVRVVCAVVVLCCVCVCICGAVQRRVGEWQRASNLRPRTPLLGIQTVRYQQDKTHSGCCSLRGCTAKAPP